MGAEMSDELTFPRWLEALERVFTTGYGYTEEQAKDYCSFNSGAWVQAWEDGCSPREAASEDQRAGLN